MEKKYKDLMTVRLDGCRFYARHGVMQQERTAGNEFEVSVEADYEVVCLNDDTLSDTISYADLYEIVKQEMEIPRNLLETVARSIADRILTLAPSAMRIRVEIRKLTPPIPGINGSAAVVFTRSLG